MSDTYVLIHGAWHSGDLLEPVADHLRAAGHVCHCPTLAGNGPDDDRATTGLQDAVQSVVDYFEEHDLAEVRLVAHSYGGMVISKVADMIPDRIRRLVYHNAFVPSDGQCLNDLGLGGCERPHEVDAQGGNRESEKSQRNHSPTNDRR